MVDVIQNDDNARSRLRSILNVHLKYLVRIVFAHSIQCSNGRKLANVLFLNQTLSLGVLAESDNQYTPSLHRKGQNQTPDVDM